LDALGDRDRTPLVCGREQESQRGTFSNKGGVSRVRVLIDSAREGVVEKEGGSIARL
jgi:hypothetical protein